MLDDEKLVYELLKPGCAALGLSLVSVQDNNVTAKLPALFFFTSGSGQQANGPDLYTVVVDLHLAAVSLDEAKQLKGQVYDLVHSWEQYLVGVVPGVGSVESVTDISLFSRQPSSDVGAKAVVQYDGTFGLLSRSAT